MEIKLGHYYADRAGITWRVDDINGQKLFPVTASRQVGKTYVSRCFQSDGAFFKDKADPFDLVREVANPTRSL